MPVEIRAVTGWTPGPLTHELRDPGSPVRRFFDTRFSRGAAGIQDRFRAALPAMVVPRATGDYATLGTAAGWLLRYLVHPAVDYSLAVAGAELACSAGVDALDALEGLSDLTTDQTAGNPAAFDGPAAFRPCPDEDLVARTCWALALLTAVCRACPPRWAEPACGGCAARPSPRPICSPLPRRPRSASWPAYTACSGSTCCPGWPPGPGCGRPARALPPRSSCLPTAT